MFFDAYKKVVFQKYATFSGRADRREYWMFALVSFLISLLLSIFKVPALGFVYWLATLIPSLAVGARRLHDTDRSGWWLLIGLIPVVGAIVLLVFMVLKGVPGANKYGPSEEMIAAQPSGPAAPSA